MSTISYKYSVFSQTFQWKTLVRLVFKVKWSIWALVECMTKASHSESS